MNMETFSEADRFNYDPDSDDEAFSGILEIHVHHARNIHNICIYDKQDVYAKFSLTYNPDETISTRIVNGGGKNPDFNDDLIIDVNQPDAVLKCEIWMLSRAKDFMDDQLLGFVLIPISSIYAGTIKLSLFLNAKTPSNPISAAAFPHPSAASQLLSDKKISNDYCRIEFPDINVVDQNRQMVSEYFAKNGAPLKPWLEKPDGSFLHLGAAPQQLPVEDYEMAANSSDEFAASSVSPEESSIHNSTMTSLSDDRNSADSVEKKGVVFADFSTSSNNKATSSSPAPKKSNECPDEDVQAGNLARHVKIEAEESAMQQQIVDMYMRSMQQFTESLAKMKLPMELDKGGGGEMESEVVVQDLDKKMESENNKKKKKKKDGCRVFYGSRAFF